MTVCIGKCAMKQKERDRVYVREKERERVYVREKERVRERFAFSILVV